jgi:plasmid stabilization system protein ParE
MDDIFLYGIENWGETQAARYVDEMAATLWNLR